MSTRKFPATPATLIDAQALIKEYERLITAQDKQLATLLDLQTLAKQKLYGMELHAQTLVKEKMFLLRLASIQFQMIALATPTSTLAQLGHIYDCVTSTFSELYAIISKTTAYSTELTESLKTLERKAALLMHSTKKKAQFFVEVTTEEALLQQLTPLFKIGQKAKVQELDEADIRMFNASIQDWIMLPPSSKWSLVRSLAVLQLSGDVLRVLCEKSGFQPVFESEARQNESDIVDANLDMLKATFVDNLAGILEHFCPNTSNVADYVRFNNNREAIATPTFLNEVAQVETILNSGISASLIPNTFDVDYTLYSKPSVLAGVEVFQSKISLCNSYVFANLPAAVKLAPGATQVTTNMLSLLMFKYSVFENILTEKSQKIFMLIVIEWLIGMHTNIKNNELYTRIYEAFNCVAQSTRLHQINSYLEEVLMRYDILVKALTNKGAEMGINVEDIIARELTKLKPGDVTCINFKELFLKQLGLN